MDRLRSYRAALRELDGPGRQHAGRGLNNRAEIHTGRSGDENTRCSVFRRMRSLQTFATVHSSGYNHFNL